MIERFIGPDILLWSSHFISKRTKRRSGSTVASGTASTGCERLQPMHVITMWLAVDEIKDRKRLYARNRRQPINSGIDGTRKWIGKSTCLPERSSPKTWMRQRLRIWSYRSANAISTTPLPSTGPPQTPHKSADAGTQCATCPRMSAVTIPHCALATTSISYAARIETDGFNTYTPLPDF